MKYTKYRLVDMPLKGLTIAEDDTGFLYIATEKLAKFYARDNIFTSIGEIELVIGRSIEKCPLR